MIEAWVEENNILDVKVSRYFIRESIIRKKDVRTVVLNGEASIPKPVQRRNIRDSKSRPAGSRTVAHWALILSSGRGRPSF